LSLGYSVIRRETLDTAQYVSIALHLSTRHLLIMRAVDPCDDSVLSFDVFTS
jgi:hypothetical protein